MITAEELTKQRGGRAVVSDVTFRCLARPPSAVMRMLRLLTLEKRFPIRDSAPWCRRY